MHDVLQISKKWQSEKRPKSSFPRYVVPTKGVVTADKLKAFRSQLKSIENFWNQQNIIDEALIKVHYKEVIAKSNRLSRILHNINNDSVRGATFEKDKTDGLKKHVITYLVLKSELTEAILELEEVIKIIVNFFHGKIERQDEDNLLLSKEKFSRFSKKLTRENFLKIIKDSYYIDKFSIQTEFDLTYQHPLVTFYKTPKPLTEIFSNLGITINLNNFLDDHTILLTKAEFDQIAQKVPYLISMALEDITKIEIPASQQLSSNRLAPLPPPSNEPTIGVIDTPFKDTGYFGNWVESIQKIDKNIHLLPKDFTHGTWVTSIIVDGPQLNRWLDDHCGRFKVRHFGIHTATALNGLSLIRKIREIVYENQDIKVWNLSAGGLLESPEFSISPEAAELDKIQKELDVIFILAGTNNKLPFEQRIGPPADSLNSLVVNSVNSNNEPATYSRHGPVLAFFNKPDISYYGGDKDREINVLGPNGLEQVQGTSFAAPWIARKVAFLIHVMGLTREEAKALLIDSARGWNVLQNPMYLGHGIVPKSINDILKTREDEIRFILKGQTEDFKTYLWDLPIPFDEAVHPFIVRATLCYFSEGNREQGVDYTTSELDIHFGPISIQKKTKPEIKEINSNYQTKAGAHIKEATARKLFRKWDNVKIISQVYKPSLRGKKIYNPQGFWGISIKNNERLPNGLKKKIKFGIVVTLKEIKGEDRFDDFKKNCIVRGWLVNELNIENQLEIHAKAEEELELI